MEPITKKRVTKTLIEPHFLNRILLPYRTHASYLKKATISIDQESDSPTYPSIMGNFEIKESCYIDDTGHFNAVEFNICYNQLGYTYLGYCISQGLLPELEGFSKNNCDDFFDKQLSHFLIVDIKSSYKRPINAKKFYGEVGIKSVIKRSKCTFVVMPCNFYDDADGASKGEVTLAILNP